MKLAPFLGWLIFGCAILHWLSTYGTRWDLSGRLGMPTTLVSADGKTYRDGSLMDDVTFAMVEQDIEQEAYVVIMVVLLVLFTFLVFQMCRLHWMHTKAFNRELRRIRGLVPREEE